MSISELESSVKTSKFTLYFLRLTFVLFVAFAIYHTKVYAVPMFAPFTTYENVSWLMLFMSVWFVLGIFILKMISLYKRMRITFVKRLYRARYGI